MPEPRPSSSAELSGPVQLGRYRLLKKLAAGGMAEVFLARTQGPAGFSKLVVVKRILPHLAENDEFVEMFLNEARLAAQLNHPNVIQIFELGQEEGVYYLAMELVDGPNLRNLAKLARARNEKLPAPVVLKIISLACEGLAYAHEFADETGRALELVHRDISPDNLLLSRQGSVKVADFGIAKAANLPNLTKTGTLKGKLNYMPPEQLMGERLDRRGDVFSLGVVLHESLAGGKPFNASSEVSAMRSILQDPPQRLAEVRPELPAEIQAIVDAALAKDRNQRYADCRAMQADIENLLIKLGASVRAVDIAALVEKYFPKQDVPLPPPPVAEVAAAPQPKVSLDPLEQSLVVSMSMVIDPGTGPVVPATAPIDLVARKPQLTPAPPPATQVFVPTQVTPPAPTALKKKSGAAGWVVAAVVVAAAGGGFAYLRTQGATAVVAAPQPEPKPAPPVEVAAPKPEPKPAPAPVTPPAPEPKPAPVQVAAPTPKPEPKVEPKPEPKRSHPATRERIVSRPEPKKPEPAPAPAAPRTVVVIQTPAPAPVPKPAPVAAPAAAVPGKLAVQIQPWAEVEVDGQPYGVTPLAPITLLAGEHKVRLKNSDLHVDKVMNVTVRGGKQETIKLNLLE